MVHFTKVGSTGTAGSSRVGSNPKTAQAWLLMAGSIPSSLGKPLTFGGLMKEFAMEHPILTFFIVLAILQLLSNVFGKGVSI